MTIAPDKYFGIAYPNNTRYLAKHTLCLSLCSIDDTCAALYYDTERHLCYTTTLPIVYDSVCSSETDLSHARVKNSFDSLKEVYEKISNVTQGWYKKYLNQATLIEHSQCVQILSNHLNINVFLTEICVY